MAQLLTLLFKVAEVVAGFAVQGLPIPDELRFWPQVVAFVALVAVWALVRTEERWWAAICVCCMVVAVGIGVYYHAYSSAWIITANERIYVKGEPKAKIHDYLDSDPDHTERDAFKGYGYDPEKVWTPESIRRSKLIVTSLYTAFVLFLAFGVYGIMEYMKSGVSRAVKDWWTNRQSGKQQKANPGKEREGVKRQSPKS